jgi:hypothetical protein
MNNISHQAAHQGVLFNPDQARPASQALCAGDIIVFDGGALRVVASGSMQLATGPVEVAHVHSSHLPLPSVELSDLRAASGAPNGGAAQAQPPDPAVAGTELSLPPALARKLAEYIGAAQGQPHRLVRGEAELIEGSRKALETFQEADRFMTKLFG